MKRRKGRDERGARARRERKMGPPVKVATARNQVEAEFIQSMLEQGGVPSMLRRSPGFDVPDFLAAGPRDVLVPGTAAALAREILEGAEPRGL